MGTNYYYYATDDCPHCGCNKSEPMHIGKSSFGWCFSLHVYNEKWEEDRPKDLKDWKALWKSGGVIKSEYGERIILEGMLEIVTNRRGNSAKFNAAEAARNQAVQGPFGLWRHRIDGHCIGHGSGTWDLITGDFS